MLQSSQKWEKERLASWSQGLTSSQTLVADSDSRTHDGLSLRKEAQLLGFRAKKKGVFPMSSGILFTSCILGLGSRWRSMGLLQRFRTSRLFLPEQTLLL